MEIKFALILLATICATQVFAGCVMNTYAFGNNTFAIDNVPATGYSFFMSGNKMVLNTNGDYECFTTPCHFSGYEADFESYDGLAN